jgi:hypothetical protein
VGVSAQHCSTHGIARSGFVNPEALAVPANATILIPTPPAPVARFEKSTGPHLLHDSPTKTLPSVTLPPTTPTIPTTPTVPTTPGVPAAGSSLLLPFAAVLMAGGTLLLHRGSRSKAR